MPIPTLSFVASTTSVFVSTRRALLAVSVPVTVAVPVTASVFAVIEPLLPITTPVSPSLVTCIRYDEPGVVVPMPNLVVTYVKLVSALNVLFAAVNVPLTVAEPVDVIVVAVIEPALSTLKLPLDTVNDPMFNVLLVMLSVLDRSSPVIELSCIEELFTELAPADDADTPVSPEPSPIYPAVAVIVPITTSAVCGVVVPMPTFPRLLL